MLKDRAKKMKRIAAAAAQLRRMEDVKLHQLRQRLAQLDADQRGLIEALNGGQLQGMLTDAMARRLGPLAERATHVAEEWELQAKKVRERAAEEKCAGRLSERLDEQLRREEERKLLAELIELLPAVRK